MANEKFLTYTEVDPNSRIAVTSSRVTWTDITAGESAYVYRDKGADFFSEDFAHSITVRLTSGDDTTSVVSWALANAVGSRNALNNANEDMLAVILGWTSSVPTIYLHELDGGVAYWDSYAVTADTSYYLKVVRDEAVGANGTLYCYIYSDIGRATLLDTLSLALHSPKKDFRYVYACQTFGGAGSINQTGYSEDLAFEGVMASLLPIVTQQTPTSIGSTTATGNGHISYLGLSPVTAHGHCWKTEAAYLADSILPLTSDNNVNNGAGSVEDFTSAVTGLTAGTRYIMRAYAQNTQGTAYSNIAYLWYSGDTSILEAGNFAVKVNAWHYVGANGAEYYLQGTPVV